MMRDFIHDRLNQCPRFAPEQRQTANSKSPEATGSADISKVLKKEEDLAMQKIQEEGLNKLMRQKTDFSQRLSDLIEDCKIEHKQTVAELEKLQETKNSLDGLPDQPGENEKQKYRQTVKEAELAIFRRETESRTTSEKNHKTTSPDWNSLSFLQLTKTGLALTWPLILAIAIAVFTFSFVFYSVFAV